MILNTLSFTPSITKIILSRCNFFPTAIEIDMGTEPCKKSLLLPKITHLLKALHNSKLEISDDINSIFMSIFGMEERIVAKQHFEGGFK